MSKKSKSIFSEVFALPEVEVGQLLEWLDAHTKPLDAGVMSVQDFVEHSKKKVRLNIDRAFFLGFMFGALCHKFEMIDITLPKTSDEKLKSLLEDHEKKNSKAN